MRSDEWWEFENLSRLPIFHQHYWEKSHEICMQFKELDCGFDVKEMLKSHPFCACSFNLSQTGEWEELPFELLRIVRKGRESYRNTLRIMRQTLIVSLKDFMQKNSDVEFRTAAANLIAIFEEQESFRLLKNAELLVLNKVIQTISGSQAVKVKFPDKLSFQNREELQKQLNDWVVQLPNDPCLLEF